MHKTSQHRTKAQQKTVAFPPELLPMRRPFHQPPNVQQRPIAKPPQQLCNAEATRIQRRPCDNTTTATVSHNSIARRSPDSRRSKTYTLHNSSIVKKQLSRKVGKKIEELIRAGANSKTHPVADIRSYQ